MCHINLIIVHWVLDLFDSWSLSYSLFDKYILHETQIWDVLCIRKHPRIFPCSQIELRYFCFELLQFYEWWISLFINTILSYPIPYCAIYFQLIARRNISTHVQKRDDLLFISLELWERKNKETGIEGVKGKAVRIENKCERHEIIQEKPTKMNEVMSLMIHSSSSRRFSFTYSHNSQNSTLSLLYSSFFHLSPFFSEFILFYSLSISF